MKVSIIPWVKLVLDIESAKITSVYHSLPGHKHSERNMILSNEALATDGSDNY